MDLLFLRGANMSNTNTVQKKASVCIIMNGCQLLVLKRSDGCSYPNKWCLPGGRAEDRETAVETMFREVEEETGIVLSSTTFLTNFKNPRLDLTIFFSKTDSLDVVIQESESADYAWIDMATYEGGVDLPPITENILLEISDHWKRNGAINLEQLKQEVREGGL